MLLGERIALKSDNAENTNCPRGAARPGLDSRGTWITGCYIIGTSGIGIDCLSRFLVFIDNNHIANFGVGIKLHRGIDNIVKNNQIRQCDTGIEFAGNAFSTKTLIAHNHFVITGVGIDFLAGLNLVNSLRISDNDFVLSTGTICINFSDLTSAILTGVAITDNIFHTGGKSSSDYGIKAHATATFVVNSIITGNTFNDFVSGNEIFEWDGNGSEAYHNISTSDDGTPIKNALADIGNPVGHTGLPQGEFPASADHTHLGTGTIEIDLGSALDGAPVVV